MTEYDFEELKEYLGQFISVSNFRFIISKGANGEDNSQTSDNTSLSGSADASPKSCPKCGSDATAFQEKVVYRCHNADCRWAGHDF